MTSENYRALLAKAESDLRAAIAQRDAWNLKVAQLENWMRALAAKAVEHEQPSSMLEGVLNAIHSEVGITEAIRTIFRTSQKPMDSADVRKELVALGYDLTRYANSSAVIRKIITRLVEAGDLAPVGDKAVSNTYRWNPASPLTQMIRRRRAEKK